MKKLNRYQKRMRKRWDQKARENAYSWVDSSTEKWDKSKYYNKGIKEIFKYAVSFLKKKKFSDKDLKRMKVLDLGCGTGRLTAGLAKYFGLVLLLFLDQELL